jgi:tRNA(Glu) U13 pseudouridine synthase TruD
LSASPHRFALRGLGHSLAAIGAVGQSHHTLALTGGYRKLITKPDNLTWCVRAASATANATGNVHCCCQIHDNLFYVFFFKIFLCDLFGNLNYVFFIRSYFPSIRRRFVRYNDATLPLTLSDVDRLDHAARASHSRSHSHSASGSASGSGSGSGAASSDAGTLPLAEPASVPDGRFAAAVLSFSLRSSCYATMLLRELMLQSSEKRHHAALTAQHLVVAAGATASSLSSSSSSSSSSSTDSMDAAEQSTGAQSKEL